jgi:hypothetical protein
MKQKSVKTTWGFDETQPKNRTWRFEAGASEKFLDLEVAGSISNWQSQGAEVSAQLTAFRQNVLGFCFFLGDVAPCFSRGGETDAFERKSLSEYWGYFY